MTTLEEVKGLIKKEAAVVLYLTADHCNVCKVLKPAIKEMIEKNYPRISFLEINTVQYPEIAAYFNAFAIPLILVFFDGKEFFRKGRAIGMEEFATELKRPYEMLFS